MARRYSRQWKMYIPGISTFSLDYNVSVRFSKAHGASQVPPHTSSNSQSRYHRSRSLPQHQSSPRSLLLHSPSYTRSPFSQEHLHRTEERLPIIQPSTKSRRSVNAMGRPRRLTPQYLSDCSRPRGEQPCRQRMGEVHPKGD